MTSDLRLIVCVNQRLGKPSCVGSGSLEYIDQIQTLMQQAGLKVPILRRECLGKCEQGPVMRIAPGGDFFTDINQASLVTIIDELKKRADMP